MLKYQGRISTLDRIQIFCYYPAMARALRIEYPGALYHVTSYGDRGDPIVRTDEDRARFVELLEETVGKYTLRLHAWVLLNDHFHLLLETPRGNLSASMHYFNTAYSNRFKARHGLRGRVFAGRFRAVLVEKGPWLGPLSAYIHLNPRRAGAGAAQTHPWGSFRAYSGAAGTPPWLWTRDILALHPEGREGYLHFVEQFGRDWRPEHRAALMGSNSILGGRDFQRMAVERARRGLGGREERELPDLKHLDALDPETLADRLTAAFGIPREALYQRRRGNPWRKLMVFALKKYTDLSLKAVGEIMDMDYAAVSQMAVRFEREAAEQRESGRLLARLEKAVRTPPRRGDAGPQAQEGRP
jgi:putative transposase